MAVDWSSRSVGRPTSRTKDQVKLSLWICQWYDALRQARTFFFVYNNILFNSGLSFGCKYVVFGPFCRRSFCSHLTAECKTILKQTSNTKAMISPGVTGLYDYTGDLSPPLPSPGVITQQRARARAGYGTVHKVPRSHTPWLTSKQQSPPSWEH